MAAAAVATQPAAPYGTKAAQPTAADTRGLTTNPDGGKSVADKKDIKPAAGAKGFFAK